MKKQVIFSMLLAVALATGLLFVSCDTGTTSSGDPNSVPYTSYDEIGNEYKLVITKDPNRAGYEPQSGDTYILTIKNASGKVIGTSNGTVTATAENGTAFTLNKDGTEFTITVEGNAIKTISAAQGIPIEEGEPITPPTSLTPNKPGTGGNSSGGEIWQKLIAGSGSWTNESKGITLTFTDSGEPTEYGAKKLTFKWDGNVSYAYSPNVYVKLNSASGTWLGNLSSQYNISFGGGSSDTAKVTFSSDTAMTISNGKGVGEAVAGSYTSTREINNNNTP